MDLQVVAHLTDVGDVGQQAIQVALREGPAAPLTTIAR